MSHHQLPPIQEGTLAGTPISVLRWDLNHATISGNKAEKLVWHLHILNQYKNEQHPPSQNPHLISMGGPWSNHLHALGAACRQHAFTCTALIRGESPLRPSPTLEDLKQWHINLRYMDRTYYRDIRTLSTHYFNNYSPYGKQSGIGTLEKNLEMAEALPGLNKLFQNVSEQLSASLRQHLAITIEKSQQFFHLLQQKLPQATTPTIQPLSTHPPTQKNLFWWIPEGGNNALSIWSIAVWAMNTAEHLEKQHGSGGAWIVPVGSSATFKGILAGLAYANLKKIPLLIGVPVFKNSVYLDNDIQQFTKTWLPRMQVSDIRRWALWHEQTIGRFGKLPHYIQSQQAAIEETLNTPLDHVYTLKTAYVIAEKLKTTQLDISTFKEPLYLLHTGGLQGNRS